MFDDDVEVVYDLRLQIEGLGANMVLEVDKGGTSDNGGGSFVVNVENEVFAHANWRFVHGSGPPKNEGSADDNGGGSSIINVENEGFGRGFVV